MRLLFIKQQQLAENKAELATAETEYHQAATKLREAASKLREAHARVVSAKEKRQRLQPTTGSENDCVKPRREQQGHWELEQQRLKQRLEQQRLESINDSNSDSDSDEDFDNVFPIVSDNIDRSCSPHMIFCW
jgi:exonuclease VII large subunit